MIKGAAFGAIYGFVGGGIGTSIGGGWGALAGGASSNLTNQLLNNKGDFSQVNWTSVAGSGALSFGMYHGFQYANWKWGGGNKIGGIDISYKQYSKINAMYQRAFSLLGSRKENGLVLNIGGEGKDWGFMVDKADRYHDHVNFHNPKGSQILVHCHLRNRMITAYPYHSNQGANNDVLTLNGYHSLVVGPTGSSTMMGYQNSPLLSNYFSSPYVRFFLFPWLWNNKNQNQ